MAKKLVKRKKTVMMVIVVLIFIITMGLCDVAYRSISGEMTLARFSDLATGLGFWGGVLLLYLERKGIYGDVWKSRLKYGGWLLLAVAALFGIVSFVLYFQ